MNPLSPNRATAPSPKSSPSTKWLLPNHQTGRMPILINAHTEPPHPRNSTGSTSSRGDPRHLHQRPTPPPDPHFSTTPESSPTFPSATAARFARPPHQTPLAFPTDRHTLQTSALSPHNSAQHMATTNSPPGDDTSLLNWRFHKDFRNELTPTATRHNKSCLTLLPHDPQLI
jgi:hypothetical protein